jgi:hypothetical protein
MVKVMTMFRLAMRARVPGVWVEERGLADHEPVPQCSGCCLGPLPVKAR